MGRGGWLAQPHSTHVCTSLLTPPTPVWHAPQHLTPRPPPTNLVHELGGIDGRVVERRRKLTLVDEAIMVGVDGVKRPGEGRWGGGATRGLENW